MRPFGVGETWRRLFDETVIKVAVTEATLACQDDQMGAALKAGIYGAFHVVQAIWDKHLTKVQHPSGHPDTPMGYCPVQPIVYLCLAA